MKDVTLKFAKAFAAMRERNKVKRLFIFIDTGTLKITCSDKLSDKQMTMAVRQELIVVDTNNKQVFHYEHGWRIIKSDGQTNKKKNRGAPKRDRTGHSRKATKRVNRETRRKPSDE